MTRSSPSRVGVAVAACLAGCAAAPARPPAAPGAWIDATAAAPASRRALLLATGDAIWRGDLAGAGVALTALADRERGQPDPALDFWSELLALLRCEPLARVPRLDAGEPPVANPWNQLRRLVQIERVRLGRARPAAPPAARMLVRFDDRTVGRRGEVTWPIENESWSDERPVPVLVTRCAAPDAKADAAAAPAGPASEEEVRLVTWTADTFPAEHPASAPLALQAAVLALAHGRPAAATAALTRLEAVVASAPGALTPQEQQQATLVAAVAAAADPTATPERLLALGRPALLLDVTPAVRRGLALALAERLDAAGRPADAVAILGPPPHGDDEVGRYIAFRQAEAHARAGRRAELLAEAREALHRHGRAEVDDDPALAAIRDLAFATLRASPVTPETLELLEAMGPPRERLSRAGAFAQAALEAGAPQPAMAVSSWLYDNDTDPGRRLQHLARTCVAAARAGARAEFARTFQLLAGQEVSHADAGPTRPRKTTPPAGGRGAAAAPVPPPTAPGQDGALIASAEAEGRRTRQRDARSADWQQALLVVARDALTALVDNDDQPDLATLVATLKRHLDDAGRGPVDDQLTTLYRAASAHLASGPRAYAETVGAVRAPILLGDIRIGRRDDVRQPIVDLRPALREAGPLVFVPRRGDEPAVLRRWPGDLRAPWTGGGS